MKRLCFFLGLIIICISFTVHVYASEEGLPENVETQYEQELEQYDFRQLEEYLNQQISRKESSFTFEALMKNLLAGDFKEAMALVVEGLKDTLGKEISHSGGLIGQILVLGILGAVFANFSSIFAANQVSETGFFVTYLLLFTLLAASFQESISVTYEVVEKLLQFMKILTPSYFLAVALAGAGTSSAAWCQLALLMIALVDGVFLHVILPLIRVYVLLIMTGHIAKEDLFSKWTDMLKTVISWGMKTLIGLVLGFQAIQSMILPFVDSMKHAGVRKLVEVVPVFGQGASSVSQMVFGAGVLIKNTMGAAGVIILFVIVSVPVFKLVILMLMYQFMAAALQPVCDKRLVSCISSIAEGHKILLQMVLAASFMFIIAIALVCITTNTTYLV